jgi:hypothetical protein
MALNEEVFDDQICSRRSTARRRDSMSAADLLRLYIEEALARGFVKTEGGPKLAQKSVAILQKRRRHAGP